MPNEPRIVRRTEQHYIGVSKAVTMQTFNSIADHIPHLLTWLEARGLTPDGAPFIKLNVIDMERELLIEAAVPVAEATEPDGEVHCGVLPAGRYLALMSSGAADSHIAAIAGLLDWAQAEGLVFDKTDTDAGAKWGCRLQLLINEPPRGIDMNNQVIENLFRLATD